MIKFCGKSQINLLSDMKSEKNGSCIGGAVLIILAVLRLI